MLILRTKKNVGSLAFKEKKKIESENIVDDYFTMSIRFVCSIL